MAEVVVVSFMAAGVVFLVALIGFVIYELFRIFFW